MCSLMFIRSANSILASPKSTMENLIPLVFSLLLVVIVVLLHMPLTSFMNTMRITQHNPITWPAVALALTLGTSMFVFQIVVLN